MHFLTPNKRQNTIGFKPPSQINSQRQSLGNKPNPENKKGGRGGGGSKEEEREQNIDNNV